MNTLLGRWFLLAVLSAGSVYAQKLVIKGSDTLGAKLVPQLAEEYKSKNPKVTFQIAAEGSTTGIAAIVNGTADIGMSSRRAKTTEISAAAAKGVKMTPIVVAYDGMAIIVNEKNEIRGLTKKQVESIFTGDVNQWSAVGGRPGRISIYTRNTSSGTYGDFKELAMRKRDYAPGSQKMAGNEQIVAEVAKNPEGIGYVGLAYDVAPGIKVIPVDGKIPTAANILAPKDPYLYSRPTFFYTNGEAKGEAAKFIDFVLSKEGAKIVKESGFVPLH